MRVDLCAGEIPQEVIYLEQMFHKCSFSLMGLPLVQMGWFFCSSIKSCFQPGGKVGKEEEPQTTLSLTTHLIHPMTKDYFRTTSDPLRPWVMLGDTQAAVTSPVIPIVRTQSLKGMAWPPHPQQPLG